MMDANLHIARIGRLLGDESRATIIEALLDGRALTAHELAHGVGISASTASFHLRKLAEGGLIEALPQGRHRYYRIVSADVATAIQGMLKISSTTRVEPTAKKRNDVCFARTCYGHLAGVLGVAVADSLQQEGIIAPIGDSDFVMSERGDEFFERLEIDLSEVRRGRRLFARQCLDWSARKPHLGGALGLRLTQRMLQLGWLKRIGAGRVVHVSENGRGKLRNLFGIKVEDLATAFFRDGA